MRWLSLGLFLCIMCLPCCVSAQCVGITSPPVPFASEVLTISDTAKPLTPAKYQPGGVAANVAKLTIETGDIRYYEVGTPSTNDGHYVGSVPPQTFLICGLDSIKAFKAIRATPTDAKATVTYYRQKTP